jgi:uncharacterized membrane protein YdbT with pleckstrin-like domain
MIFKKHFPGQLPEEKIFKVIHRHWFNLLSHFINLVLLGLATVILFFFAPALATGIGFPLSESLLSFITTTVLLFLWVYAFFIWIDYYFDVWVITDERVLNIEQKGLFTRVMSEVQLHRVQDVTTKVEGFLPTILNYGDIFVQTAGEEKRFHFRNVGDPEKHTEEIMSLVKKARGQATPAQVSGETV